MSAFPLAVFAVVGYLLWALGRAALEGTRFGPLAGLEGLVHGSAVGAMLLCVSVSALGALGLLFPVSIWIWLCAALVLARRQILRDAGALRQGVASVRRLPLGHVLLGAAGLGFLLLAACAAFREPGSWDEVAYTLFLPKEYVRRNGFPYIEEYGPYSAFPAYQEMLSVAGLLLGFRHVVPHLFNVWTYALVGLAGVLVARRIGIRGALLPATFLLIVALPAAVELAPLTKNDLLLCLFQLVALDCVLERNWNDAGRVALSGAYCGFALGIKYTAVPPACLLCLVLVAVIWNRGGEIRRVVASAATFAGMAFLVASPWALRDLLATGDPVFPLFGDVLRGGGSFRYLPVHSRIMHQATYGLIDFSLASSSDGLSPLFARIRAGVGLLPYLNLPLVLLLERRRIADGSANLWPVIFLATALLPIWILFLFWEPRYVLFLQVLLVLLVPLSLERLQGPRWAQGLVAALVVGFSALPGGSAAAVSRPWRAILEPDRRPLTRRRESFIWLAGYLNQSLPPGARVATNAQPFYYLEHPIVHLHPMSEYGHFQFVKTPAELVARFRELRVDFVAYGEEITPPENYTEASVDLIAYLRNLSRLVRGAEEEGRLRLLRTLGGVKVYAVPAGAGAGDR